jgi:hypothetical protein
MQTFGERRQFVNAKSKNLWMREERTSTSIMRASTRLIGAGFSISLRKPPVTILDLLVEPALSESLALSEAECTSPENITDETRNVAAQPRGRAFQARLSSGEDFERFSLQTRVRPLQPNETGQGEVRVEPVIWTECIHGDVWHNHD